MDFVVFGGVDYFYEVVVVVVLGVDFVEVVYVVIVVVVWCGIEWYQLEVCYFELCEIVDLLGEVVEVVYVVVVCVEECFYIEVVDDCGFLLQVVCVGDFYSCFFSVGMSLDFVVWRKLVCFLLI